MPVFLSLGDDRTSAAKREVVSSLSDIEEEDSPIFGAKVSPLAIIKVGKSL